MILTLLSLLSSSAFALTNYAELTTLLANHPEAKVEDVLGAIDSSLYENHILLYHVGGLLTATPKAPAVAISSPLNGSAEVAEQKPLMTVIFQTDETQGRAQEIEVMEWDPAASAISFHRISFDPVTKRLQRIENNPSRCLVCHGFSNDGNRNRPIWDSYSKNSYSGTWGSFPDVAGGGLSFEPRIYDAIKNSAASLPRLRNVPFRGLDTTPGFSSTLQAMNWVSFSNEVAQKISALPAAQAQNLKSDFNRYLSGSDNFAALNAEPSYQTYLKDVIYKRKTYLREKFGRSIILEGMFATTGEKDSVRAIADAGAFANADHDAFFQGDHDDLTLARIIYVLKKNGLSVNSFSMSLTSEVYTTRSAGTDDHINYFVKRVNQAISSR